MRGIWRFFDGWTSGIVIADDYVQARERAVAYLKGHFEEDDSVLEENIQVWNAEKDDDFNEKFPYALAVCY